MQEIISIPPVAGTETAPRKECQKCILHDGIQSVEVGDDGICNYCKDPTLLPFHPIPEGDRQRYEADLEATLQTAKGQGKRLGTIGEYDVVMGLSGGKDSTFLLYTLINKYGLKVLPVAVDMGFMPKVAKDNIAQACRVLGVECVWYDAVAPFFIELYQWIFAHRHDSPPERGVMFKMLTGRICHTCSDLLDGFIVQEAATRRIPLVLIGLSPDENSRLTYEIPPAVMGKPWALEFVQALPDAFSPEFRAAWWDPACFPIIPRVLAPYHAWKYNEAETIAAVEKLGLIPPKKADPLVTNCDVLGGAPGPKQGEDDVLAGAENAVDLRVSRGFKQGEAPQHGTLVPRCRPQVHPGQAFVRRSLL